MRFEDNLIKFVTILVFSTLSAEGQLSDKHRRRLLRILLFPRGSSLQLVYCLTIPTVNMPNIFVIGVTGSLAWELPYNPNEPYRKRAELLHRRIDKIASGNRLKQDIRFRPTDDRDGFHLGSAMTKYPINATYDKWNDQYYNNRYIPLRRFFNNKLRWQAQQNKRKYLYYRRVHPGHGYNIYDDSRPDYDHPIYNELHRRSRRDLYGKIEKFLQTMKMDGKACVLKMLCRINKIDDGGGSFMEEVIKRIFRNKRSHYDRHLDKYDHASTKEHDCETKYPECEHI